MKKHPDYWQKHRAADRAIEHMRRGLAWMADGTSVTPRRKECPPSDGRYPEPDRRLRRLSGKQNHRCCYCGGETTFDAFQPNTVRVEYVIPPMFGGTDHELNTVMACASCPTHTRDDYAQLVEYAAEAVGEYLQEQQLLARWPAQR